MRDIETSGEIVGGVGAAAASVGILLFALAPLALPILVLTMVALAPLALLGLIPLIVVGLVAAAVHAGKSGWRKLGGRPRMHPVTTRSGYPV